LNIQLEPGQPQNTQYVRDFNLGDSGSYCFRMEMQRVKITIIIFFKEFCNGNINFKNAEIPNPYIYGIIDPDL
jgi:hypothetical protein